MNIIYIYIYVALCFHPLLVCKSKQNSPLIYLHVAGQPHFKQKMRHVKFNFIQCKIATCSSSSGCANCCKIGPTCPHLAQDRPNMAGAWPKKDGFPQPRPNFS